MERSRKVSQPKRAKLNVSAAVALPNDGRSLRHVFSEAQESCLSHARLGEEFTRIFEQLSRQTFMNELHTCLQCAMAADEKAGVSVQNMFNFIAARLTALAEQYEDLLEAVIRFALNCLDCASKTIRTRSCALIGCVLTHLGQNCSLPEALFDSVQNAMLVAMRDKNFSVRCEAIYAAKRLQNVSDQKNCPVIKRLLAVARRDAIADVRVAAIETLVLTSRTIDCVIDRCRDVSETVRRCAVETLAQKVNPANLRLEMRLRVLSCLVSSSQSSHLVNDTPSALSLVSSSRPANDAPSTASTSGNSVQSCKLLARVASAWLSKCGGSLVNFVHLFDVQHNVDLLERVVTALLEAESRCDAFERLVNEVRALLDQSSRLIEREKLTVDSIFALHMVCAFLRRRKEDLACAERRKNAAEGEAAAENGLDATADITIDFLQSGLKDAQVDDYREQLTACDLVSYVLYLNTLLKEFNEKSQSNEIENEVASDSQSSNFGVKQFILEQLLALADYFDDIDESGRRRLLELLYTDLLSCRALVTNESVCRRAVRLARRLELMRFAGSSTAAASSSSSRSGDIAFVEHMLNTISELRAPSEVATTDAHSVTSNECAPTSSAAANGDAQSAAAALSRRDLAAQRNGATLSSLHVRLCELRVEINEERERIAELVQQELFSEAAAAKRQVEELESQRRSLQQRVSDLERVELDVVPVTQNEPVASSVPPMKEQLVVEKQHHAAAAEDDDPETLATCLILFKCMLTELPPRRFVSSIMSSVIEFFRAVVVRCVPHRSESVRMHAIECAALCGLVHAEIARRAMNAILVQAVLVDLDTIKPIALRAIFDFLCQYGFSSFESRSNSTINSTRTILSTSIAESDADCVLVEPSNTNTNAASINPAMDDDGDGDGDALVDDEDVAQWRPEDEAPSSLLGFLKRFLGADEDEPLRSIALEGFAKLLFNRRLRSPAVLSRLVLRWYDPRGNEGSGRIAHALANFWPLFAFSNWHNQLDISSALLPILDRLLDAPADSPLGSIDVENCYTLLINLTNTSNLSKAAMEEMNAALNPLGLPGFICKPHDLIACAVCQAILQDPESARASLYARVLSRLSVSISEARINELRDLDRLAHRVCQKVKEKSTLRTVSSVAEKLHATLAELEQLAALRSKEASAQTRQQQPSVASPSCSVDESRFKRPLSVNSLRHSALAASSAKRVRFNASTSRSSVHADANVNPSTNANAETGSLDEAGGRGDVVERISSLCIENSSLSSSTPLPPSRTVTFASENSSASRAARALFQAEAEAEAEVEVEAEAGALDTENQVSESTLLQDQVSTNFEAEADADYVSDAMPVLTQTSQDTDDGSCQRPDQTDLQPAAAASAEVVSNSSFDVQNVNDDESSVIYSSQSSTVAPFS